MLVVEIECSVVGKCKERSGGIALIKFVAR